jgi:uncharacterized protein (DUF1810 family)
VDSSDPYNLKRFVDAQQGAIDAAIAELRAGAKRSHWMWFVFPQLAGLGHSPAAKTFGLDSIDEARAYLAHDLLGPRLNQCVDALLPWAGKRSAEQILGPLDSMKLRSSLTLFDCASPGGMFERGLRAFFDGRPDERTLALLNAGR